MARWEKLELALEGPRSEGRGNPNPFAVEVDAVFTGPDGRTVRVPGFYDGNGKGGLNGNIWKIRFAADRNGAWSWRTTSSDPTLADRTGRFVVTDPAANGPEFYRKGRLEYAGERYLKFREGGYWIKFGADEPENLLGKAFGADDWEAKKRQIEYLASKRINSVYVMTHNLDGDDNDVWPWLGATSEEAKANADRFDVAKLQRWRELFEHIQAKGIVIQLVLEDDSAWKEYDHARYYREMVARFGDLPALYFNFGEEHNENYSLAEALDYMKVLAGIDPYHHPRAIHNVNQPVEEYIDSPHIQVTSIQTGPRRPSSLNAIAVEWIQAPLARGTRPLVVSFDEGRPAEDRRSWWSVYLGGGNWESLARVPEGFATQQRVWEELAAARAFMGDLPVHQMHPANHVVTAGQAFCLAKPGELYALYLPQGGGIEVQLTAGNRYKLEWFDPRAASWGAGSVLAGGRQLLSAPASGDWAARITRTQGNVQGPPTAFSAKLYSQRNRGVPVRLAIVPPADAKYEIVAEPRHGTLTGTGANRVYTPKVGFTGSDSFQWRALTGSGNTNVATVTVLSNATGENAPPKAYDQTFSVPAGKAQSFSLRYEDADGPGPYQVRIVAPPRHGTAEGLDNDIVYTPAPGFRGEDSLQWTVSDGKGRSNRATARLLVH